VARRQPAHEVAIAWKVQQDQNAYEQKTAPKIARKALFRALFSGKHKKIQ
jgi:hypothetical protein